MRQWLLRLLGIHTCNDCCYSHNIDTVSIACERGIVYGTTPDTVRSGKCMKTGNLVDFNAVRQCGWFKRA
jgi:hypothetical protein